MTIRCIFAKQKKRQTPCICLLLQLRLPFLNGSSGLKYAQSPDVLPRQLITGRKKTSAFGMEVADDAIRTDAGNQLKETQTSVLNTEEADDAIRTDAGNQLLERQTSVLNTEAADDAIYPDAENQLEERQTSVLNMEAADGATHLVARNLQLAKHTNALDMEVVIAVRAVVCLAARNATLSASTAVVLRIGIPRSRSSSIIWSGRCP